MNTDPDPGFDESGPNLNPDFDPDLEQGFSRSHPDIFKREPS
jgi:hypothetical protein